MNEIIKSIVFAIIGALVVIFSLIIKDGTEILCLGIILTAFSIISLILSVAEYKKTKKVDIVNDETNNCE